jgi:hypothetical protein
MRTSLSGPVILYGNDNPQQISETDAGPNIDFQGSAVLDPRYTSQATAPGSATEINTWFNSAQIESLCMVPTALSTTRIAAAQAPTVGGFFTLAAVNATGVAVNVPLIPFGNPIIPGSTAAVNVLALDFGFALGTTTTGATAQTVTITGPISAAYALRFFYPGQNLIIPGAGNAGGTLPLLCTVLATPFRAAAGNALSAAGTITISKPALAGTAGLPIGTADPVYGVATTPVVNAGAASILDPSQAIARATSVTASGASSGTVTVRGYDIYEQAMSETITIVGTGTGNGKKAFAYISSVQLNTGAVLSGTLAIGVLDVYGIPLRQDLPEYLQFFQNGTQSGGTFVAADQTVPATSTTGDVRGTYALSTAANGTNRYVAFQTIPLAQAARAYNIYPAPLVGVTNA